MAVRFPLKYLKDPNYSLLSSFLFFLVLSCPSNLILKSIGSFAALLQPLLHPIPARGLFAILQGAGAGGVALGMVNNVVRTGGAVAGVVGLVAEVEQGRCSCS